ncbi:MAG: Branched-chain-amino-acid aminotransferase [Syntrophomonadaceae bacterium]|nr:Branched-chain-amino-acid aminotransferase [Bacillota bacterium]
MRPRFASGHAYRTLFQMGIIYFNGNLTEEKAVISPVDRGFLYGDGVFETMRSYGGRIFHQKEHLVRLFHSAEVISLKIPYTISRLKEATSETLLANRLSNAYIRITVSRGDGIGLIPPSSPGGNLLIVVQKVPLFPKRWYTDGLSGVVVKIKKDSRSPLSSIKSLNYLPNILAKIEAQARNAEEGIILNSDCLLSSATASNIFLVSGGKLFTPSLRSSILAGITRRTVIEIVQKLGHEVCETEIRKEELARADEAFLTSSVREIVPLTSVDEAPIGGGKAGEITKKITYAYRDLVRSLINKT